MSSIKIYLATSNQHKAQELRRMFETEGLPVCVESAESLGGMPECDENGDTFEANARIKACALKAIAPKDAYILADDSGIVVDALGGRPGIYSARYAGVSGTGADAANNEKLLKELAGVPEKERTARFVCALKLLEPSGGEKTFTGTFEGVINHGAKGENGFGYDPLFFVPKKNMTSAQLPPDEKNQLSHRGKAQRLLAEYLKSIL